MSDNAQQIEYWNGAVGERWARLQQTIDTNMAAIMVALMAFAAAKRGEHVLDIGCGAGTTTLAYAQAVGANGAITGVDISRPMLDVARGRAKQNANVTFVEADASAHSFKPEFDLIASRFGIMFFADPLAAFANIRKGLKQHGRLAFVCWRSAEENLWASAPYAAARDLLSPPEPSDPLAPGPFAFADAGRLRNILDEAGFADIRIDALDSTMNMGADTDEAAAQAMRIGPLARAVAGLDDAAREKIRNAVMPVLARYKSREGITPPAACWLVGATL
jgi:ubiquinone/menaquinone biosynthesis C-methylase UbiE